MADEEERPRYKSETLTIVHSFDRATLDVLKSIAARLGDHQQLDRIERTLASMTTEMRAAWTEIDNETTRIADAMEAALKDDPEALAKVQSHLTAMKAIGKNPEDPLPDARGR